MNINQLFTEANELVQLNVPDTVLADASFPASGSFFNVSKYQRVGLLVMAGSLAHEITFTLQQATAINGALKDVETAAKIVIPANGDNKWYFVELDVSHMDINHNYRFLTATLSGSGAGDYAAIALVGMQPTYQPVTQGATKGAIVTVVG